MKRQLLWYVAPLLPSLLFLAQCSTSTPASCPALSSGASWVPNIPGVTPTNHDGTVVVSSATQTTSAPIVGLAQPAPSGTYEVSFSVDMTADLGLLGSLMLIANVSNMPADLQGSAYPFLVSLNDGTNELINLPRSGGSDCAGAGYYTCTGGNCLPNPSCAISQPSAYANRTHWEERQAPNASATNSPSVNIFPTCNWAGGSSGSATDPNCAFNSSFLVAGKLRSGTTYTAKYVLVSDSYTTVTLGHNATLTLTVVKKTKASGVIGGAVDLNVVLVGTNNINSSRTAKGQQNLNSLISNVAGLYGQAATNIKIGTVTPIEWSCPLGGDSYSSLVISQLGNMFASSSTITPVATQTKAINIFLVSSITDDTGGTSSEFTILGYDGAIGGPLLAGTAVSGVTVSTFDSLDTYNASCPSSASICASTQIDTDFNQLSTTITHEMGHYFGLNHPSEYDASEHDQIHDTPFCTTTANLGGINQLTINSCLNLDASAYPIAPNHTCHVACSPYNSGSGIFCPTVPNCEFNYVMWWTVKNFLEGAGTGDGNLFSPESGYVVNYHPVVQ